MDENGGSTDHGDAARANGLGTVLRRTAARSGSKTALIDGPQSMTYVELDSAVDAAAASLQWSGVGAGDRVAILSRNCWQFVVMAWGAARRGAVLVPLNFMLTPSELSYLLTDAEVSAIFVGSGLEQTAAAAVVDSGLEPLRVAFDSTDALDGWVGFDDWLVDAPAGWTAPHVADDAIVRIMYTSGTESRPKGVMLSSRALIAEYVSCIVDGGMSADDVDLHTLPLYHCAQLDCFLGPDVMLGATSVILPAPEPAAVLAAIEQHEVSKYFAPPTVWISILRSDAFDTHDLSTLRKGYYGASPMPPEILREIIARMPELDLWNFYGQTEIAPVATILPPHEQLEFAGSAGRPVLNVETRVVDDFDRVVVPLEVGEVVHRTPQATLGYWRDPDKTAAAFSGGWFRSGDLGFMDGDGRLTIVDRKKDMIKTGGENVASREVEEVLYSHPDIVEVAVFATPDPKWVEVVTAAVVMRAGSSVTPGDIVAYARIHLAPFKSPKIVHLVAELPKNPSGKILKRALREQLIARP
ncbi:AMP-binding protein [Rhodococcus fascians]|nr:AMP-binding protein [Rhodococcus fascians]MBY3995189.1 AMP-binding protein [Rhodococcus fascians]MBY4000491.1 AMP-binding protein [Rhodococcus fascians]MBY4005519.1 AMP-binding protein [Rhodococcus fascians]MBY4016352.1 AMP-binding protein [Rhodococcus fascians]